LPGNGGHALGGFSAQQGGGNGQHSVQRLMVDYCVSQSAAKFAPGGRRIVRDFNAPPYQGRVALGEIPPRYRYVTEGYTLNAYENPGYPSAGREAQGAFQGTQGFGQQNFNNRSNQNVVMGLVDQLMSQVTDMVQKQFDLKPKNPTITYKKPSRHGTIR
jgi:hypothetical protein